MREPRERTPGRGDVAVRILLLFPCFLSYERGVDRNPKFRVTRTYVYCTYQFKDMLYAGTSMSSQMMYFICTADG